MVSDLYLVLPGAKLKFCNPRVLYSVLGLLSVSVCSARDDEKSDLVASSHDPSCSDLEGYPVVHRIRGAFSSHSYDKLIQVFVVF